MSYSSPKLSSKRSYGALHLMFLYVSQNWDVRRISNNVFFRGLGYSLQLYRDVILPAKSKTKDFLRQEGSKWPPRPQHVHKDHMDSTKEQVCSVCINLQPCHDISQPVDFDAQRN